MKIRRESLSPVYFFTPVAYFIEFLIWRSFPQSHSLNGVLGALWTLGQFGILFSLYQIYDQRILDKVKSNLVGVSIAAVGAFCYICNYIGGYWLGIDGKILLPLGALLTALGMTTTGIQMCRNRYITGVKRFAPLLVGLYPFLVMFPVLVITGHPDLTAIMGWGIPWLLFAFAMTSLKRPEYAQKHRSAIEQRVG